MDPTESAMTPSVADQFLYLYQDMIAQAMEPLQTLSLGIFWFVTMLSVAHLITEMVATDGQGFDKLLRKFATMAFYHLLIVNFPAVIGLIQSVMVQVGIAMGGGRLTSDDFLLPSRTLDVGIRASGEIWAYGDTLCTGLTSCAINSGTMLLLQVVCIGILILFGLAALMVTVAQLVFQLHALWALATLGTLMDSRVSWIGEKGLGGVFANAIKLGVLATLVSLADGAFLLMDFTSGTLNAIFVLFVVFMAVFMIWQSSSLAAGIINGGPSIGGESLLAHAVSTGIAMTGVGSLAGAAGAAGHALRSGASSSGSGGGGGGARPSLPPPGGGGGGGALPPPPPSSPGNNAFAGPQSILKKHGGLLPPPGGSPFAAMQVRAGRGP